MSKITNILKTLISLILVCIPFVVFIVGIIAINYYSANENLHNILYAIGTILSGIVILSFSLLSKHVDVVLESVFNIKPTKF